MSILINLDIVLKKTKDYQLLLAGVLIFYFVFTFDVEDFSSSNLFDYLRAGLALVSLFFLIWYNVKSLRSRSEEPVKFEKIED